MITEHEIVALILGIAFVIGMTVLSGGIEALATAIMTATRAVVDVMKRK